LEVLVEAVCADFQCVLQAPFRQHLLELLVFQEFVGSWLKEKAFFNCLFWAFTLCDVNLH
jgi:uncharacterized membrane protein